MAEPARLGNAGDVPNSVVSFSATLQPVQQAVVLLSEQGARVISSEICTGYAEGVAMVPCKFHMLHF